MMVPVIEFESDLGKDRLWEKVLDLTSAREMVPVTEMESNWNLKDRLWEKVSDSATAREMVPRYNVIDIEFMCHPPCDEHIRSRITREGIFLKCCKDKWRR